MPPKNSNYVGVIISELSSHVTHLSECHRKYGTNAKKKRVNYVVLSVEKRQIKNDRSSTYINAEYDFGNGTKNKAMLFISSVREYLDVPAALASTGDGESHPTTTVRISMKFIFQYITLLF